MRLYKMSVDDSKEDSAWCAGFGGGSVPWRIWNLGLSKHLVLHANLAGERILYRLPIALELGVLR